MTEDRMYPNAAAHRRVLRLGATLTLVGLAWFAVAFSASAEIPSPSADATTAPGPSASVPTVPTPGPSDAGWMFATPAPSDEAPRATAPPLPSLIVHPDGAGANGCYDCHSAVNDKQATIAEA
ncbi:MAG: hypothetical protein Q8M74_07245, partial [Chloroflexota bacterium]|nr:hypothetical protein [Chloroflexota bacterium]